MGFFEYLRAETGSEAMNEQTTWSRSPRSQHRELAREVLSGLRQQGEQLADLIEVVCAGAKLLHADDVDPVVAILKQGGWLRPVDERHWEVNPRLWQPRR